MNRVADRDLAAGGADCSDDDDDDQGRFSDWVQEEGEEDEYELRAILQTDILLPSVPEIIAHCAEGGLDLCGLIYSKCGWGEDVDEVRIIMLLNFIRAFVRDYSGDVSSLAGDVARAIQDSDACFVDANMMPVFPGDDLLFLLPEYVQSAPYAADGKLVAATSAVSYPVSRATARVDEAELAELRQRLKACEALVRTLAVDDSDVVPTPPAAVGPAATGADSGYFGSYSHLDIHEVMLNDFHRTDTYAAAIMENADFIKGRIVLDVGCGTGILSMLAARAGAKMVIGIDVSDILNKTRIIVERNGYKSVIHLVQGKLEECVAEILLLLPEDGKVDCIVSEWMGYGLYYENMFASVIFARDKFLRAGGLMLPSRAQLFLEAMTTTDPKDDRVSQWNNMYGFQMQDLTDLFVRDAQVQIVTPASDVISERQLVHDLDLSTASDADLDFAVNFNLKINSKAPMQAFVITFDTIFDAIPENKKAVVLTTAVQTVPTHWKHTVLWLSVEARGAVSSGAAQVAGVLTYERSKEHSRDYAMTVEWGHGQPVSAGADSSCVSGAKQTFYLSS